MSAAPRLVSPVEQSDPPGLAYRIYRDDELHLLPQPSWAFPDFVPAGGLVVLVGYRGDGKTFWLLDLLASLATGRPFCGRRSGRGWGIYVGPEGTQAFHRRIEAWKAARGHRGRVGIAVLPQGIQLLELAGSVMHLAASIDALDGFEGPPSMIIVDTLSRNAPGARENSQEDMSLIVASCDFLRKRFGCAVVLAHHPRKGDDVARGSSVLDGAADTVLLLKKEGNLITLSCMKQKDAPEFDPVTLELRPVGASCALLPIDPTQHVDRLTPLQLQVLQVLSDIATSDGCSTTVWMQSSTHGTKVSQRTFYSAKKTLLARGYVLQVHGGRRYAMAPDGLALLQLQSTCNATAIAGEAVTAGTAGGYVVPPHCSNAGSVDEEATERAAIQEEAQL